MRNVPEEEIIRYHIWMMEWLESTRRKVLISFCSVIGNVWCMLNVGL